MMYRNIFHTKQCPGNNMLHVFNNIVVINVFGTVLVTCLIRKILNDMLLRHTDVLRKLESSGNVQDYPCRFL